jgi:putative FmdB family regulatory protein
MPTYEFRCPKGHEFDKFYRSMSGAPLEVACPTCGKTAVRQVSAGAGLVFKGSGFYITDYGKDGKKPAPAATTGGTDSPTGSAEAGGAKGESAPKSDAKPVAESKSGGESKPTAESKKSGDSKPPAASKSAAKKSSGRAKSSE